MTPHQTDKPIVAAFDFDGTLTRHDSLLPFLILVGGYMNLLIKFIYLLPTLLAYTLRFIPNNVAKNKVLRCFLVDMEMSALHKTALVFAERKIPAMLRSEAMQRFSWHKQQGHRCVIISASLEHYLHPWGKMVGFDDILGSRLEELENGRTTGQLLGNNCYGPVKMQRLEALLGPREHYTLYAYGDSRGDKELLSAADYPFYKSFTQQGQYQ